MRCFFVFCCLVFCCISLLLSFFAALFCFALLGVWLCFASFCFVLRCVAFFLSCAFEKPCFCQFPFIHTAASFLSCIQGYLTLFHHNLRGRIQVFVNEN